MGTYEYSPLQRVSCVGEDQVQVYIYRQPNECWFLHLVNAHGASRVLDKRFDRDDEALKYFDTLSDSTDEPLFPADPANIAQGMVGFNVSLLSPQYAWYRDMKSRSLFTLCKFDLVHKYTGLWPAQNLQGHKITGYLYNGESPAWPHPPQGLPGAPENIEMEFTILPKHIDFYVETERGLRDSSYWKN
mgnify:CR=1 FL=1|jgi:hypothetical protein